MERLSNLKGRLEASEEAIVMEKSIVNLIRAALLQHGTCAEMADYPCIVELYLRLELAGICHGFDQPMEGNEMLLDRAKSLSWLHLLAAVPLLMVHVTRSETMRLTAAVQTASIAIALMEHGSKRWKTLLEPYGLSLREYELVVRMHQSMAVHMLSADLPTAAFAKFAPIFQTNIERIYSVQPINNWNLMFCRRLNIDEGQHCQVLREALKVADDRGDDSSSICLRWDLCQAILLGAEGPSFAVEDVLSVIRKARAAMHQAEKWTDPKRLLLEEIYWPCMGVAARYRAAMKKDPSFVHSMMEAYASVEDLEREKRHVRFL
ncbi:hypothetical protein COCOBI_15-1360 [Coccomyxa sp. Obi]|nr:hypothetical protein COCOBI_15-1360 [Coccomyxa sp. Obi]